MTFSIVARSADGSAWGVAVASKFLGVGSAVPAAVAGIGAVATQASANVVFKPVGLSLMAEGATAAAALERMIDDDEGRDHRQVGIIDVDGNAASYTGTACLDWAGGIVETGVAVQGNILVGPEVVAEMLAAWEASDESAPLGHRLLAALRAGDDAGGDRRGRQSAALFVVSEGAGYDGGDDIAVDLRVDDHRDPCGELARLVELHDLYLTASTEEERVTVDDALRSELESRATGLGHADFDAWVGTENYEMRVGARLGRPARAGDPARDHVSVLSLHVRAGSITATVSGGGAAVFDLAHQSPGSGRLEQSPEGVWRAVLAVTRSVLDHSPAPVGSRSPPTPPSSCGTPRPSARPARRSCRPTSAERPSVAPRDPGPCSRGWPATSLTRGRWSRPGATPWGPSSPTWWPG